MGLTSQSHMLRAFPLEIRLKTQILGTASLYHCPFPFFKFWEVLNYSFGKSVSFLWYNAEEKNEHFFYLDDADLLHFVSFLRSSK